MSQLPSGHLVINPSETGCSQTGSSQYLPFLAYRHSYNNLSSNLGQLWSNYRMRERHRRSIYCGGDGRIAEFAFCGQLCFLEAIPVKVVGWKISTA